MEIQETKSYITRATVSRHEFDILSKLLSDDYRNGALFIDSKGNRCRVVSCDFFEGQDGKKKLSFMLTTGKGIGLGEIVEE